MASPHQPRKLSLTPLQSDILREVADPVEVDPAYVCILASSRMPQSTPEEIVSASEDAVRGLARFGLISACRWTPEHGEAHEVVNIDDFFNALHEKVHWDRTSGAWRSAGDSMEIILDLTPEGEARLHK